jgi:hypothetical protein
LANEPLLTTKDVLTLAVSTLALSVSAVALLRNAVNWARPVLVFVYDGTRGWVLSNIGNGPALNLVVAQKRPGISGRDGWFRPVRVPPLAASHEAVLDWLQHTNDTGLGVEYEDVEGRKYCAHCGADLTRIRRGPLFPWGWQENEIVAKRKADLSGGAKP